MGRENLIKLSVFASSGPYICVCAFTWIKRKVHKRLENEFIQKKKRLEIEARKGSEENRKVGLYICNWLTEEITEKEKEESK